jgi:hypothetical protein
MTYLIDTDWVIDHLNHIERVTRRLEELAPGGLGGCEDNCVTFFDIGPRWPNRITI